MRERARQIEVYCNILSSGWEGVRLLVILVLNAVVRKAGRVIILEATLKVSSKGGHSQFLNPEETRRTSLAKQNALICPSFSLLTKK